MINNSLEKSSNDNGNDAEPLLNTINGEKVVAKCETEASRLWRDAGIHQKHVSAAGAVSPEDLQPPTCFDCPARCQRRCLILPSGTRAQQLHRACLRVTRRSLLGNTTRLVDGDRWAVPLRPGLSQALVGSLTPYPCSEPPDPALFFGG